MEKKRNPLCNRHDPSAHSTSRQNELLRVRHAGFMYIHPFPIDNWMNLIVKGGPNGHMFNTTAKDSNIELRFSFYDNNQKEIKDRLAWDHSTCWSAVKKGGNNNNELCHLCLFCLQPTAPRVRYVGHHFSTGRKQLTKLAATPQLHTSVYHKQ